MTTLDPTALEAAAFALFSYTEPQTEKPWGVERARARAEKCISAYLAALPPVDVAGNVDCDHMCDHARELGDALSAAQARIAVLEGALRNAGNILHAEGVDTAFIDAALASAPKVGAGKFALGDRVRKVSGSSWQGLVVGAYSTTLTPEGYAVESEREPGSVQVYPAKALELVPPEKGGE